MLLKKMSVLGIIFNFLSLSHVNAVAIDSKDKRKIIQYVDYAVSKKTIMEKVRALIPKDSPTRFIGTIGHRMAQNYIREFLTNYSDQVKSQLLIQNFTPDLDEALALQTRDLEKAKEALGANNAHFLKLQKMSEEFKKTLKKHIGPKGVNLIWRKLGHQRDAKKLVLTAHYDSVVMDKTNFFIDINLPMPGADHNASGVAILMEMIPLLHSLNLAHTVEIVFLDYQSMAFLGSWHHARELKKDKNVLGVVNLDMLGHDSKSFDKLKRYYNFAVYGRKSVGGDNPDKALHEVFVKDGGKRPWQVRFNWNEFEGIASDQFRYWENGISAITFSQDHENDFNERGYMTKNDLPETLNQSTLQDAARYLTYCTAIWGLTF